LCVLLKLKCISMACIFSVLEIYEWIFTLGNFQKYVLKIV
jgi:hypothetical protein